MQDDINKIEINLINYFSGDLPENEKKEIDDWRKESPENENLFQEIKQSWDAVPLLKEMEKFNSFEALKKVNSRLSKYEKGDWLYLFRKIAAILIIPLLIYSGYFTIINFSSNQVSDNESIMLSMTSKQGQLTDFILEDGTHIWLNSGSSIEFPNKFSKDKREVKLNGEAYFEVSKNLERPFVVMTDKLNVEVFGTSFNIQSFNNESISEIVLTSGKVRLFSEKGNKKKNFGFLKPGQRAFYDKDKEKVNLKEVDTDKYTSWREGVLIFRDDPMDEVVKRLNRWFNVEIIIKDPEVEKYIYTATFSNETLSQVMYLLKVSAPIDYSMEEAELSKDGNVTKQKIILMKKK